MDVPFTPALVVDVPVVRRNIERLVSYARGHGFKVRPHTKTHKSVRVSRMQMEMGCTGLTVAKLGEAEVLGGETEDLLIGYPALDAFRSGKLARMARGKSIRVALDSAYAAERIGEAARAEGVTIGVLADLDVGHHRTGVQTPELLVELAKVVDRTGGVRLDGMFCFPGHLRGVQGEQMEGLKGVQATLAEAVGLFKKAGLNAGIVSGGSTPSAWFSHYVPAYTEIRPGTNTYNDMNCVRWGCCALEDCAARVVCTVVSDAVPGKFVIDGGSKTFTSDRAVVEPEKNGFGYVVEYPDARVVRLSEEHAEVDASRCVKRPRLGERVTVIPNHVCPCVNLHDVVWFREADGRLTEARVEARGKIV